MSEFRMRELPKLREGEEWATAPLLDPANVGKYVWRSWNGNHPSPIRITKVGRTNVHVERESFRVNSGDPSYASGRAGGRGVAIYTEQHRIAAQERGIKEQEINRRLRDLRVHRLTDAQLDILSAALGELEVSP